MSSFHNIKFEKPGYPIYKAFIVPYREGDKLLNAREVTESDIKAWADLLERLREYLEKAIEFAERHRKYDESEKLELICDLIALFFKIPLNREPLPTVAPSPLKLYTLFRLIGFDKLSELVESPLGFSKVAYERELVKAFLNTDVAESIDSREIGDLIEHCWYVFPADTRPGFNTSGLIPHLLLTSALAWAQAINNKEFDRKTAAMLRLAAMLHDMGKPFRYKEHVNASLEVAERLLSDLLPTTTVNEVKEFIVTHHGPKTPEGKVLEKADRNASALDRIRKLKDKIIKGDVEELAELTGHSYSYAYSTGPEAWEFWCKVNEKCGREAFKRLSEKFVTKLREYMENFTKPIKVEGDGEIEGVKLALIDVGGVQSFILRAWELKCVAAASLVVDTLTMAQLPAYIQAKTEQQGYWIPYEAFLYTAGAIVEFIIPNVLVRELERSIKGLNRKIAEYLPLRFVSTPMLLDYATLIYKLSEETHHVKFRIECKEFPIKDASMVGMKNTCELCYLEPPEPRLKVSRPEGDLKTCRVCYDLHKIGLNIHFKSRYCSLIPIKKANYSPANIFGMGWDDAKNYIIELISGHDRDELEGGIRERNIAIVKVDGNLMGLFMATCISPTDVYERSARIDLALKKAIETAVEALFDGVFSTSGSKVEGAKSVIAVKLGVLYAGGDDAVLLLPSWAAPLIVSVLGEEFRLNLGEVRGLAIGVTAAPAKANIWPLLDATSMLMKEAKNGSKGAPDKSVICFDAIEAGSTSGASAEARLDILTKEKLTSQPLSIKAFNGLLATIIDGYSSYDELAGKSYALSRPLKLVRQKRMSNKLVDYIKSMQRRAKNIRSAINEILTVARSALLSSGYSSDIHEYMLSTAYLYAIRQKIRAIDEEKRRAYEDVAKLAPAGIKGSSMFSDADRLIKMLGGGIL